MPVDPAQSERQIERRGRPRSVGTDAAILDAAIELLSEQGYHGFTVEALAQRAGVAKTTIYRRWPGKDEIVFEAICKLKGPVPQVPGQGVRDDLLILMQTLRSDWGDTVHGKIMRRLVGDGTDRPEHYRQYRERLVAPRQRVALEVLARGVDEGLIRPDVDLPMLLDIMTAPIVTAVLTQRDSLTPEQVEFTVDTVLRGAAP